LRQLQQRVSRRFRLEALDRSEVHAYIDHRLALARNGSASSRAPGAIELTQALAEWSERTQSVEFTPGAVQAVFECSHGLPRVVNLLCDRSLEEACASGLRIVDDAVIHKAAGALGLEPPATPSMPASPDAASAPQPKPEHSFWLPSPSDSLAANPPAEPVASSAPVESRRSGGPIPARRQPVYALVAITLALIAFVAVWFALRTAGPSSSPQSPTSAPPPSTRAPGTPSAPVSDRANVSAPKAVAPASPTIPPTAPPPAAAATATGERFDIVVASFRTDVRAAAVAAEIETIGLPVRRRVSDTWQQVVVGPFASRTIAEDAQQRLARAGLGGTQIVPVR